MRSTPSSTPEKASSPWGAAACAPCRCWGPAANWLAAPVLRLYATDSTLEGPLELAVTPTEE